KYLYPDDFLRMCSQRTKTTENARTVLDVSGVPLIIKTNKAPSVWTSFDDEYLVCDSYDKEVEDALQKSKTQCLIYSLPVWEHRDDAIPDLPPEALAALLAEAK